MIVSGLGGYAACYKELSLPLDARRRGLSLDDKVG